jgi:YD repeat-containing protein
LRTGFQFLFAKHTPFCRIFCSLCDCDAAGRLARVTGEGTETSAYGAGGERTAITAADGTTTRFVYGIDGELLAEYRGSFAAPAPQAALRSSVLIPDVFGIKKERKAGHGARRKGVAGNRADSQSFFHPG